MFRTFTFITLISLSLFASTALAESVGCGNTCNTNTQSAMTEASTDSETSTLIDRLRDLLEGASD